MTNNKKKGRIILPFLILSVIFILLIFFLYINPSHTTLKDVKHKSKSVNHNKYVLKNLLTKLKPKNLTEKSKNYYVVDCNNPKKFIIEIVKSLKSSSLNPNVKKYGKIYSVSFKLNNRKFLILIRKYYKNPKIAVLIDDVGYKFFLLKKLKNFNLPLSFAIFPNEVFSKKSAVILNKYGFETLLHMPMEPLKYKEDHSINSMLTVNMSKIKMKNIINNSVKSLKGIVGINNHIGSKFTSDENAMKNFLSIISKMNLFFIDSYTISTSVAEKTALNMMIPTYKRDVFLDNSLKFEKMNNMWNKALKIAKKKGKVLIIGHFYPNTINFILKKLPLLKNKNFDVVYVSEILE